MIPKQVLPKSDPAPAAAGFEFLNSARSLTSVSHAYVILVNLITVSYRFCPVKRLTTYISRPTGVILFRRISNRRIPNRPGLGLGLGLGLEVGFRRFEIQRIELRRNELEPPCW